MTAESMAFSPYPPGVGPLCGAELEAWYEDLQDILCSDAGGLKSVRPAQCPEEPEFLDVLETCSFAWLTDGQLWAEGEPLRAEPPQTASAGGDLLPPEFFELLSEGAGLGGEGGGEGARVIEIVGCLQELPEEEEEEEEEGEGEGEGEGERNGLDPSLLSSEEELPSAPESPPSSVGSQGRVAHKRKRSTPSSSSSFSPSSSSSSPSGAGAPKKSRKERELENERRVVELTEQNERLKAEIERLSEEVQHTRRALIEKLVNTKKS
ncbi:DNA damage-inducible transcript 3 protein isoform X2 [Amia ocellicauda]|uniref:DNA damage-inducible transcript 3 protein isoform X2 n=1 Tax=Amia ocellicauda TaxID=2972642 RepID=UPI003463A2E3